MADWYCDGEISVIRLVQEIDLCIHEIHSIPEVSLLIQRCFAFFD